MSWLWIYITLMEWVGIVLVVKALGDDTKRFSFRKTGVYFCVYVVYSVAFDYFSLPPMFSVTSYLLLFAYIWWTYRESFIRNFLIGVVSLVVTSLAELLLTQVIYLVVPISWKPGMLEIAAATIMVIGFIFLPQLKLNRLLGVFDKKDFLFSVVAILSFVIFAPLVLFKIIQKLNVADYIYIVICIVVSLLCSMGTTYLACKMNSAVCRQSLYDRRHLRQENVFFWSIFISCGAT